MSSLVSIVLFLALVATSICVLAMYRKLKQLESYHAEYKLIFDQSAHALGSAGEALRSFNTEGREVLQALGARIEEARSVMAQLAAATQNSGSLGASTSQPEDRTR